MPGSYTLKPIEAKLTHDTELIGRMSPYCAFQLGETTVKSNICKKGGKNPHWDDVVTLPAPVNNESILNVHVMDKDRFTQDDQIGSVSVDLSALQTKGQSSKWYPLYYNNEPAGELLLEASFIPSDSKSQFAGFEENIVSNLEADAKIYQEQRQVVEPHTFTKEIDVVETVPVIQNVEVMEPVKIIKDVEYTEVVPVKKQIETVEPQVVKKEVEVIEPRVVTKTIQVVENVPVMKEVEVIESKPVIKEVETFEPQTFTKQVEVTDYVPVTKQVEVTEPIHVKKSVEFVEPVITTQTITKEIKEPVIVSEDVKTTVGPATMVGAEEKIMTEDLTEKKIIESEMIKEEKF
jgi:hypothetical protein